MLPNIISMLRVVLTPVVIILLMQKSIPAFWLSLILFTIAALTDFWDGYLARMLHKVSAFGAYLDPLADKILVLSTLAAFAYEHIISVELFLIFLSRDVLLTWLRSVVAARGLMWQTSYVAKWKTFLQFIVLYGGFGVVAARLGLVSLPYDTVHSSFLIVTWIIALLTLYTAIDYLARYVDILEQLIIQSSLIRRCEKISLALATMGFAWFRVLAPGTVASVVATIGAYYIISFGGMFNKWIGLGIGILFFLGWICATQAAHVLHDEDPGIVVIDEIVAMFAICYFLPIHNVFWYVAACVVFRFFDILKPYPINFIEQKVRGGLGIMVDDLAAAVYTILILLVCIKII